MKKVITLLGIILIVFTFTGLVYYKLNKSTQITSPIPEFLSSSENDQVNSLDFWLPALFGFFDNSSKVPNLTAKSALVYDLNKDEVIFEKNAKEVLPMASLTKIMTAMVAIDNKKENDRYIVRDRALVGENTIGLSVGEEMSLEELLYGVFMYSANDAAEVLADNILGREKFITAMNNKTKALGLTDTNFTNPTGLQGDGDQHTTVYDLLVISRHAIENYPEIVKAASTREKHLPATENHYEYYLYSQLNLLATYPGVKGLKDGYTPEAGWCLITYLEYDDEKLIGIILGSENRRDEMKILLDYSLTKIGKTPPEAI